MSVYFVTVVNAPVPMTRVFGMKTAARVGNTRIFSDIARENHHKLIELEEQENAFKKKIEISALEGPEVEHEISVLQGEIYKSAIQVIIFSAMALEAYIYDYAARTLTDTFVKDYLDKLDPVSKWVVIPQLLTGKELPRDLRWFTLLKRLIRQRNSLIHHKSSSPPLNLKEAIGYYRNLYQSSEKLMITAKEAVELLDLLPGEIRKIDAEEYIWAQSFLAAKSDQLIHLKED